ncbi:MAG TPA: biotin--[acetyl-CoA-carboxylase] ligase [Thioalkalivibrio sp.]|nr:biotin--[acetyl-CoA-carboxylase] ligase [Thioalkalivibrio sp.]
MPDPFDILDDLACERFCSGETLAARHGVSRMAIWKAVQRLVALGVAVDTVRGRGYRLAHPIERLDPARIRAAAGAAALARLDALEVLSSVGSTNQHLASSFQPEQPDRVVVFAEHQAAGRGRRGRQWASPFAANLYLSLRWQFQLPTASLSLLSLAVASELATMLAQEGLADHGIKWPNDIYWRGRKLGGLLLELAGEQQGPCTVVIGLGLNWRMPALAAEGIDQPWVDLTTALGEQRLERNYVAGRALHALVCACDRYEAEGFEGFVAQWHAHDLVRGRVVDVHQGERISRGRAIGIDAQGRLEVECEDGVRCFSSGEVSVRTSA